MEENDPLLELIQSMSAVEKGYFKKQSLKTGAEYLLLFDELNKLDKQDAKKLKSIFEKTGKGKSIAVAKNYLFDAIVDSLVDFRAAKNIESRLNRTIDSIRVLYTKGLYASCEKLLAKAKQTANDYQLYPQLLQLFAFEYIYNQFRLYDSAALFEEERRVLDLLKKLSLHNEWYTGLMIWLQKNDKAKSEKERQEIDALYQSAKGFDEGDETSFRGLNTFHAADTIYHYATGNNTEAVNAKIRQLENYLANPLMRESNYRTFLLVYANALSLLYNNKETDRFENLYKRFREYVLPNSSHLLLEKEIEFAHGIGLFKLRDDPEGGFAFLGGIREGLETIEKKISLIRFTDICFNAAVICFRQKDFKQAQYWLNKIVNDPRIESRQYIYCCARIFELIVQLELGNHQLLQSLSTSTFRYLYKRNRAHDFETLILAYLKKFIRTTATVERKHLFTALKKELEEISKDPVKAAAMEHFDYISWLEEKTT
ncbi:MAG: hypothetical protein K0S33_1607 [Bacteroidetes bacterium]|jgi:hypothetical protein|nr:hypothetical protein [Bacteroidota bacterium]